MMAMARETIVAAVGKMGIMESGDGVDTVAVTATDNSIPLLTVGIAVWTSRNILKF